MTFKNFVLKYWKFLVMAFLLFFIVFGITVSGFKDWNVWYWLIPAIIFFLYSMIVGIAFLVSAGSVESEADKKRKKLTVNDPKVVLEIANEFLMRNVGQMIDTANPKLQYVGDKDSKQTPMWIIPCSFYHEPGEDFLVIVDAVCPENVYWGDDATKRKLEGLSSFVETFAESPRKTKSRKVTRRDRDTGEPVEEIETVEQVGVEAEDFMKEREEERKEAL